MSGKCSSLICVRVLWHLERMLFGPSICLAGLYACSGTWVTEGRGEERSALFRGRIVSSAISADDASLDIFVSLLSYRT